MPISGPREDVLPPSTTLHTRAHICAQRVRHCIPHVACPQRAWQRVRVIIARAWLSTQRQVSRCAPGAQPKTSGNVVTFRWRNERAAGPGKYMDLKYSLICFAFADRRAQGTPPLSPGMSLGWSPATPGMAAAFQPRPRRLRVHKPFAFPCNITLGPCACCFLAWDRVQNRANLHCVSWREHIATVPECP